MKKFGIRSFTLNFIRWFNFGSYQLNKSLTFTTGLHETRIKLLLYNGRHITQHMPVDVMEM